MVYKGRPFSRTYAVTEQFSFPGLEPAPQVDSLFFAVLPDAEAAGRLSQLRARLAGRHRLDGSPVTADRLHVTLRLVGNYAGLPASAVEAAKLAAGTIAVAPFDIAFSHTASFGGGAVVLRGGEGTDALIALGNAIGVAMMKAGLKPPSAPSKTPHMTLLYDRASNVPEEPVEPLRWTAREFVLVHSRVGLTEHKALARWPLCAGV